MTASQHQFGPKRLPICELSTPIAPWAGQAPTLTGFWILDLGDAYVQALATWDSDTVWLEARASQRALIGLPLWQALGFDSLGSGPNPSLELRIEGDADLKRIADIGARALVLVAAPLGGDRLFSTLKLPGRLAQIARLPLSWS